jgi:ribose transport system permease protein
MSGMVGMLYVGYTSTSFLNAGDAFLMTSVAAVVVGGTSAVGGEGGYAGTLAGAIIMTVLIAILTVINIQESGRKVVEGLLILLLVFAYSRKRS